MHILLAPGTVTSCCLLDGLLGAPSEAKSLGHTVCSCLQCAGTYGRSTEDRRPSGLRLQAGRAVKRLWRGQSGPQRRAGTRGHSEALPQTTETWETSESRPTQAGRGDRAEKLALGLSLEEMGDQ